MRKVMFAMAGLVVSAVAHAGTSSLPKDFRYLDANADGYLGQSELPKGCVLARQFAEFDVDHNKLLDAAELIRAEQIMRVRLANRSPDHFLDGSSSPEPKLVSAPDGFIESVPSH
ncbi:MAG: hypothetical protein AB1832_04395 [Pseudomonadota bacterium]